VPLEHLEHTARMLQSCVRPEPGGILRFPTAILTVAAASFGMPRWAAGPSFLRSLIQPGLGIVLLLLRIPARKKSVEIFGVPKVFAQDGGSICVRNDVVVKDAIIFENVANQGAEKNDVGSGAQRQPDIGHGGSASDLL